MGTLMVDAAQPQVLVADDDPLLRAIVEHRLAAAGYGVAVAADGRSTLEQAGRLHPQAIVLDAMMPVIDGFETLRRLKAEPGLRDIPVIMLTAIKRDEDIVGALKLGAADYLVKPFNPDELAARLMRLVPRPEIAR
jgi:DNA-binding response OmpR family regulator